MEANRLTLDSLAVQSFIVDPEPRTAEPRVRVEPVGYETDEGRLSICLVSCAGTCGGC